MPRLPRRGLLLAGLAWPSLALAQSPDFPSRPLRLVVPFAPGGAADQVGRMLAEALGARLGQTMVVENRPGAGATLGADLVARSPADGYTLLYGTPGPQIINPSLMPSLPYDPVAGFAPIIALLRAPNLLVVHPALPARSVAELIALAKARPGELTFGSSGVGASSHLAGEMMKHMAGVDMTHVPFRGSAPAIAELLAGRISMLIDTLSLYGEHLMAGTLRALAVSTPGRSFLMPELPTIAETLLGFDASAFNYLAAPAGTPPAVLARLNREANTVLADEGFRRRLTAIGLEAIGGSAEDCARVIITERERWRGVIRAANVRLE